MQDVLSVSRLAQVCTVIIGVRFRIYRFQSFALNYIFVFSVIAVIPTTAHIKRLLLNRTGL